MSVRARGAVSGRAVACVWILFAVAASAIVLWSTREAYPTARQLWLARASGWLAALYLGLALAISPLASVCALLGKPGSFALPRVRRAFGLAAATGASLHAAHALLRVDGVAAALSSAGWLRAGLGALACLMALAITSFPEIVRRLRLQNWKALHVLVFVAAAAVCAHALLGPFGQPSVELLLSITFFLLIVARPFLRLLAARTAQNARTKDP
jgi:DMSO/TMAO reductase YedYZ heme-binding membrane subunit